MRSTPFYLLMLSFASSCADPPLEPAFEIAFDGARVDGRFVEADAEVTFHAEAIAGRDAAAASLDLGDRRLDVVLDRTDALLTEDAHGGMFTAGDRELMLGLRDHLFAADPALLESMPGLLLAKVADRYAEVPLDLPRHRLDTRLDAPHQEGKADSAPGACGDDGVTCLAGTYGSSWTAFAKNDTCESYFAPYGDSSCRGRCGLGCSWFDEDYTWDCHDHDICLDKGGNCSDEFADAADDWVATSAPYCWGGSDRPKPPPPTGPVCGNSVLETGEACDDGNTISGDGCHATCLVEPLEPEFKIRIEADIDGSSRLMLKDNTAQWKHLLYTAPGRQGGASTATRINGVDWFPSWPDVPTVENRHCNCISSVFAGVTPVIPHSRQVVLIEAIQARGAVRVIQSPTAANSYTAIIEFDDNLAPGSSRYIVDVGFASVPTAKIDDRGTRTTL